MPKQIRYNLNMHMRISHHCDRCIIEGRDGRRTKKSKTAKTTSKENGIDQKTNSVNMDSE